MQPIHAANTCNLHLNARLRMKHSSQNSFYEEQGASRKEERENDKKQKKKINTAKRSRAPGERMLAEQIGNTQHRNTTHRKHTTHNRQHTTQRSLVSTSNKNTLNGISNTRNDISTVSTPSSTRFCHKQSEQSELFALFVTPWHTS